MMLQGMSVSHSRNYYILIWKREASLSSFLIRITIESNTYINQSNAKNIETELPRNADVSLLLNDAMQLLR